MMTSVAFFTVCGGRLEYEFLLGAIREHAKLGCHVILDVTPAAERKHFRNLPDTVIWIYDDAYRSWQKNLFCFRTALLKAYRVARSLRMDVVMHLDTDEFLTEEATKAFDLCRERRAMLEHPIITWDAEQKPRVPVNNNVPCWSRRIWPSCMEVDIPPNMASKENIEQHPIPLIPHGTMTVKVELPFHHHLHWAFPAKGSHVFSDWPESVRVPWPPLLRRWRDNPGAPPSMEFS